MPIIGPDEVAQQHRRWIQRVIRPIARLAVRLGVPIQSFTEAARNEFLRCAQRELARRGEKVNVSRLAVMTGLQRREVTRLLEGGDVPDNRVSLPARVLGQWQLDRRFSNSKGARPLELGGNEAPFSQLVQSVSKDLHPGTVLFELERSGAVTVKDGVVTLRKQGFSVRSDREQGYRLLASDIDDLIDAVHENVTIDRDPPHLHAKTEFDNIRRSAIPTIRRWFYDEGSRFHVRAREFLGQFDRDMNPDGETEPNDTVKVRAVVGTFSFITEDDSAALAEVGEDGPPKKERRARGAKG